MAIKQLIEKYTAARNYYLTNKYNETMLRSDIKNMNIKTVILMKTTELENLWNEFANIQINKNDCTEVAFHILKAGTSRVHIWEWFNKNLPYGLQYMNMTLVQLEALWDDFSNILINNDDEIETDFYCWGKGTYRFDVWHWLDERLPNGIAEWVVG